LNNKAKNRQWLYLVSGLAAALIPIAVQLGIIDAGQGEQSNTLVLTIASLFGAGGAVTAAHQTKKQRDEGLHDPALPPIDQLQESANQVLAQAQDAQQNMEKLQQISGGLITGMVGSIPGVGPIAASLTDQVLKSLLPQR
jgi:hypothetical protein